MTPPAPTRSRTGSARARSHPAAWPVGVAGVLGAMATVVAVRSPYAPGSYGICPSVALFGIWCPACGGLRATHDLAHGELAAAWAMNPVYVAGVPLLVAGWIWWLGGALGWWRPARLPGWTPWAVLGAAAAYTVVRNLPGLEALAPGP